MEFLSQFDTTIHYLPGEKNTVADALSRLPESSMNTVVTILVKTSQ